MKKFSLIFIPVIFIITSCSHSSKNSKIITILHAGSLSAPFKAIADSFETENPEITVNLEASGSLANARKIIDLNRNCDIFASADYLITNELLMPDYTDFNIVFAGNEMAIAYTQKSKYNEIINDKNWYEILLKNDVIYGRSDPNSDPCGYRTEILIALAEKMQNSSRQIGTKFELLNKNKNSIRPKEVDLIALLQTNSIDYAFLYLSVCKQHNLNYLKLPDSINLSNHKLKEHYRKGETTINFNNPNEKKIITGEAILYSITVLKEAYNKPEVIKFFKFFFDEYKGQKILKMQDHAPLDEVIIYGADKIPGKIKPIF